MSNVNANTIRAANGSLGTDIRIKNTSLYESDGGTSVTQNLVQGLGKSWCDWNQVGTQAIRDSFNISGITDGGTGKTTVAIANDMASANWAGVIYQSGYGSDGFDNNYAGGLDQKSASSCRLTAYASSLIDAYLCTLMVMGDLA